LIFRRDAGVTEFHILHNGTTKRDGAKAGEILHVPRDDDKVVFQSRCRNQTVRSVDGLPLQLALPFEYAPSFRNRLADG
jgi:hypothetical protein